MGTTRWFRDKTHTDTWRHRAVRLGGMEYEAYLKSDEWLQIKAKAATRPYYQQCLKCGSTENLNLHHQTYIYIGTKTPMKELIALCGDCHVQVHRIARDQNIPVRKATRDFLGFPPMQWKRTDR